MSETALPKAVSEGKLTVGTVTLRTYVLEDGRRIINADDANALFAAWARGEQASPSDAHALSDFLKGRTGPR